MSKPEARPVAWLVAAYLALAIPALSYCLYLTPPFQVPDEPQHFLRAYAISQGALWSKVRDGQAGAQVPASLAVLIGRYRARDPEARPTFHCVGSTGTTNSERQVFAAFPRSAFYFPLAYLPQAIGVRLSRWLGGDDAAQFASARAANAAAGATFAVLALLQAPELAAVLAMLALLPMTLFEMASVSPDATVITGALCYVACCHRALRERRWTIGSAVLATVSALAFVGVKPVYAPMLVYPFVPAVLQRDARRRVAPAAAAILLAVSAACGAWLSSTRVSIGLRHAGADAPGQLRFVLGHLGAIPGIVAGTASLEAKADYFSFVGDLGWLQYRLPRLAYRLAGITIACAVVASAAQSSSPLRVLAWRVLIALCCIVAIYTVLYLAWTPPGARFVDGMQGRYLIPPTTVILAAVAAVLRPLPTSARRALQAMTWAGMAVNLLCMVHTLEHAYASRA